MCSQVINAEYTKVQNGLLLLNCDHIIHRQCLKDNLYTKVEDWRDHCPLCNQAENLSDKRE